MIYRICDTLNPSNCDTAIVKINVLAPNILATNDSASVNGFTGSVALINVLENDTFFQLPVLLGHVRLNMLTLSGNPGVSLDTTTGYVKVLANTLPGIYTMEYRISDTLNPANTDTALIYIQVKSGEIIANRDSAQVNGYKGLLNLVNILNNDTLNGSTPNANQVKIKELASFGFPGLSLDTLTGWISVQPRTNAGSYNLRYLITDTTDINNTDTGEVSISVIAVGPVAMPDSAKTAAGLPVVMVVLLSYLRDFGVGCIVVSTIMSIGICLFANKELPRNLFFSSFPFFLLLAFVTVGNLIVGRPVAFLQLLSWSIGWLSGTIFGISILWTFAKFVVDVPEILKTKKFSSILIYLFGTLLGLVFLILSNTNSYIQETLSVPNNPFMIESSNMRNMILFAVDFLKSIKIFIFTVTAFNGIWLIYLFFLKQKLQIRAYRRKEEHLIKL
jgi:hypothetical protein